MKRLALALLTLYQRAVSPMLPPACRFTPTCSEYARIAIETHGVAKGSLLALRRVGRCHPLNPGGFDPVPGTQPTLSQAARADETAHQNEAGASPASTHERR
jgi:putative membrane protein insertion efficiency factor